MTNTAIKNEINDIPKGLKSRYLLNSNKKVVQFELIGVDIKRGILPKKAIPGEDVVYDPDKHIEYKIYWRPKLVVDEKTKTNVVMGEKIWFERSTAGRIICHLDQRQGRQLYEFLSMSNHNASNPFRDKSYEPIFKLVDDEAVARLELATQKQVDNARNKVFNAKLADLRMIADWMGLPSNETETSLRKTLLEEATHRTRTFNEAYDMVSGEDGEYLSTVIRATKHNVIYHNTGTQQWTWRASNQFFFAYKNDLPNHDNVIRLARWLKEGEGGGSVYKQMREALKPFEKEYAV